MATIVEVNAISFTFFKVITIIYLQDYQIDWIEHF